MLPAPRLFYKWKERHQVRASAPDVAFETERRTLTFTPDAPRFVFSSPREALCCTTPLRLRRASRKRRMAVGGCFPPRTETSGCVRTDLRVPLSEKHSIARLLTRARAVPR
jgi:hypothetical protein